MSKSLVIIINGGEGLAPNWIGIPSGPQLGYFHSNNQLSMITQSSIKELGGLAANHQHMHTHTSHHHHLPELSLYNNIIMLSHCITETAVLVRNQLIELIAITILLQLPDMGQDLGNNIIMYL
jgi:hypothetical protein